MQFCYFIILIIIRPFKSNRVFVFRGLADLFFCAGAAGMAVITNESVKKNLTEEDYIKVGLIVSVFFVLCVMSEIGLLISTKVNAKIALRKA